MKRDIDPFEYAPYIMKQLKTGILVTTKAGDKVNSMTISWGTLGIQWNKPIFIVFVKESRYTKQLLDINPEFTLNIPYGDYDKRILEICGGKSGRDTDKIKELNLTTELSKNLSVPTIKQFPLTLECKVIYKQKQDELNITTEDRKRFYPEDSKDSFHAENRDFHTAYYGEIVSAYIIE